MPSYTAAAMARRGWTVPTEKQVHVPLESWGALTVRGEDHLIRRLTVAQDLAFQRAMRAAIAAGAERPI